MLRGEEAENAVDELRKNPMLLGTEVQVLLFKNSYTDFNAQYVNI